MTSEKKTAEKPAGTFTSTFNFQKDTKNALRYEEEAVEGLVKIGSLYVQKHAFKGEQPAKITLTVAVAA